MERLAGHWPDNPYGFRVAVIEEAVPNAFAVPGGLVLVTSGLLEHVGSENELAFVLAHELGHFHNRDHITTLGRSLVVSLALGSVDIDTSGLSLFGTTGLLTERSFGRNDEREADRFGLALLYAEYGHIGGAADFLQSMTQGHAWERVSSNMLGTHPFGPDRARELQALALEEGWPVDGPRQPVAWSR